MLQENDPEEDIPSDTDEYVEQSPDGRWYRRDQPVQAQGIGGLTRSFLAIDMEEGKEVVWNEIEISQEMHSLIRRDTSKEAMEAILKIFKRIEHVNLIKYSGYWIHDSAEDGMFKIVYITEYTSAGTLRSFLRRSRINKKKIGARVWRRWSRQILRALDYLHSCAPSITHGHLNCDSIYIHHDGIIKVGSVAPNIIKDFLSSLLEDKDFDEKACYKTPNSKDISDFGNCLLEVFATGVEESDMRDVAPVNYDNDKKKKNRRDLTEDERRLVLETCGANKGTLLTECFGNNASVGQLLNHTIFIEVPPLKVIAYYAMFNRWGHSMVKAMDPKKLEQGDTKTIIVDTVPKKHETSPLDIEKLTSDVESGMFPLCGIKIKSQKIKEKSPTESETEPTISKAEDRLILKINGKIHCKGNDPDKANLSLEFTMNDHMVRKMETEISLKEDSPAKLTDELIDYNLLNKKDREMVIESIQDVLSS